MDGSNTVGGLECNENIAMKEIHYICTMEEFSEFLILIR